MAPSAGLRLLEALATPHGVDRYLELIHPMLTIRELRAEVTAVHRSTADTVTLRLRPHRRWRGFTAGQYVRVAVDIDGVRRTRCYSPAGSQHEGGLELTIKAHEQGLVSRYLHRQARPGLVIGISPAEGTFTLPPARPDKVLLVSGGSGITPVLSMLRTLCDEGHRGQITFLHYAYREADVPYLRELRALAAAHRNVTLVLAYTDADADGGDLSGFFDWSHLMTAAPWVADARTYLCGPPGLMTSVRDVFAEVGLSERLHTEDFAPAPVGVAGDVGGTIGFARSGLTGENSGKVLLEQAEDAGLRPEHGCRMGICFSCTRVKTAGCVRNVLTGELTADPDTEIQLCVSVPVGDVTIDL